MAVIQEAFYIPEDILDGILTGELVRMGGVVRYASGPNRGQIVKHLESIDVVEVKDGVKDGVTKVSSGIVDFAKNNKVGLIVGAGIVVAAGGAFVGYKLIKREPKELRNFRKSLKVYLDAIRKGAMVAEIIDDLMDRLEALRDYKNYEKLNAKLIAEDLGVLANRLYVYTTKLAKDNSVPLTNEEKIVKFNPVDNLEKNLEAQRRIFKVVA